MVLNDNKEESKGSKTPTQISNSPFKIITPLIEKYKQNYYNEQDFSKGANLKSGIDGMANLRIDDFQLSQAKPYDNNLSNKFPDLCYKQYTPSVKNSGFVNDEDITPSYTPIQFPKPLSECYPMCNPFILEHDKTDDDNKK